MSSTILAAAADTFSAGHIALTGAITGVLALIAAAWRLPRRAWPDTMAIGVLAGVSVFLWRISANMPQLNSDGLPGFSANDWLAPVLTYVFLTLYADLRSLSNQPRFRHIRALAVVASLAVNVITI
ncbi:hypothetical protein [Amycolatopsis taiwanensis]|uniref:hypothetical protein n=1 Tax=Amycolatopsis taiwanensis TaxID=342230 RepID=UPI0004875981|nr:hypothetical protein [Amycolatopsis taiwanensis]